MLTRANNKALHPRPRALLKPAVTKARFIRAIHEPRESFGVLAVIARNLDIDYQVAMRLRDRRDWEDVRVAIAVAIERAADHAEQRVHELVDQRIDSPTALRAATWLLSRPRYRNRNMGDQETVVHEGGDKPIRVAGDVPIDVSVLPLETRKQLLQSLREKEKNAAKEPKEDTDDE